MMDEKQSRYMSEREQQRKFCLFLEMNRSPHDSFFFIHRVSELAYIIIYI